MDFQIHRYANNAKSVDLVILVNFAADEAAALTETDAWNQRCIRKLSVERNFWDTWSIHNPTFRHFVNPGILIEDIKPQYADSFQHAFQFRYAPEIQQSILPVFTTYRRKIHRDQEAQRDAYFGQLQLTYNPQTHIFYHDQRYLPAPG